MVDLIAITFSTLKNVTIAAAAVNVIVLAGLIICQCLAHYPPKKGEKRQDENSSAEEQSPDIGEQTLAVEKPSPPKEECSSAVKPNK